MWDSTETSGKIRSFLKDIPEKTRRGLALSIERARFAETSEPIHEFLLKELHALAEELGETLPRPANARRVFYEPVEPFLVDYELPVKVPGRVARQALVRVFSIIEHDVAPEAIANFTKSALEDPSPEELYVLSGNFRREVVDRMSERIKRGQRDEVSERKLLGHLGGERMLAEFIDIHDIHAAREQLQTVDAEFRSRPETPDADLMAAVGAQFRACAGKWRGEHVGVILRNRLDGSQKLPRMAVALAGTGDIKALQASPYAALIDVTLSDIELAVAKALKILAAPAGNATPVEPLKEYAMLARHLRAALDLDDKVCDWQRRLTGQRTKISSALSRELGELPPLLRRCIRPLTAVGARPAVMPDEGNVAQARRLIALLDASRLASTELALNELVLRVRQDVEAYLEFMVAAAVEDLRNAKGAVRAIAQAQANILLRLHEAMFGETRTAPVRRSMEMASSNASVTAAAS